jgi:hypothetical protein
VRGQLQTAMSPHEKPSNADSGAVAPEKTTATPMTHDFGFLPIPRRLRYDPEKPFRFGLVLNVLFGFASTFTVANLYYCQVLPDRPPLFLLLLTAFYFF